MQAHENEVISVGLCEHLSRPALHMPAHARNKLNYVLNMCALATHTV